RLGTPGGPHGAGRHPALLRRFHPGGRPDCRAGDRGGGGWLVPRRRAGRGAVLPTWHAAAATPDDPQGGPAHGARLRGGGVPLLPHTARRSAGHAGRGRRCHPAGPPVTRPVDRGELTWRSPWSRGTSPPSGSTPS